MSSSFISVRDLEFSRANPTVACFIEEEEARIAPKTTILVVWHGIAVDH